MSEIWFRARGDHGSTIISSNARSLVYRGKANHIRTESWFYTASYFVEMINKHVGTPMCRNYIFSFVAPDDEEVTPAVYANTFCALVYCRRVSGRNWEIQAFSPSPPEIHIFSPIVSFEKRGYMFNVYDETGRPAFSTSQNHMMVRGVARIMTDGSAMVAGPLDKLWAAYPSNTATTSASIEGIKKPLLISSISEHALGQVTTSSMTGSSTFCARGFYANSSGIFCRWVITWLSGSGTDALFNAPGQAHDIIVLDLADYE